MLQIKEGMSWSCIEGLMIIQWGILRGHTSGSREESNMGGESTRGKTYKGYITLENFQDHGWMIWLDDGHWRRAPSRGGAMACAVSGRSNDRVELIVRKVIHWDNVWALNVYPKYVSYTPLVPLPQYLYVFHYLNCNMWIMDNIEGSSQILAPPFLFGDWWWYYVGE
jgi:hypothetical protein